MKNKHLRLRKNLMTDKVNTALPFGSRIGILGSGQLGRLLSMAAANLGFDVHIYAPDANNSPAGKISPFITEAAYNDEDALRKFASEIDVLTYESENIPLETLEILERNLCIIRPSIKAIKIAQDRLLEKTFIRECNIPVADFVNIDTFKTLEQSLSTFDGSGILKTRKFGYDGKGQWLITPESNLYNIFSDLDNRPAILERLVPFDKEVSIIAARCQQGNISIYDLSENQHRQHILHTSLVPAHDISDIIQEKAKEMAKKLLESLDYIGILSIELFVCGDNLLINEIAPRIHNSGHWTHDACYTGQFEQHIRAITGQELGDNRRHHDAVMTNLLGDSDKTMRKALESSYNNNSCQKLYIYGKQGSRPNRKMAHITALYPLGQCPE